MPSFQTYSDRPVVLLTNDDGPPCASSPNIYGFSKLLRSRLGWDVRVVIPDCKAYAISETITASYFYPLEPDGLKGEITPVPRPLKEGESMEWVLLSGTPATCANIALHNLYPGEIDYVISGPNHGRNSSTAFALSSGTIGAALSGAMAVSIPGPSGRPSLHTAHIPCLAVSYGVVTRPTSQLVINLAHDATVDFCKRIFDDWGWEVDAEGRRTRVQLYSINVKLIEECLQPGQRKACWTDMWKNSYGRLFKVAETVPSRPPDQENSISTRSTAPAGPGALPTPSSTPAPKPIQPPQQLRFQFAPDLRAVLAPRLEDLPEGSDAWAFEKGYISIVPMRAEHSVIGKDGGSCVGDDGRPRSIGTLWE